MQCILENKNQRQDVNQSNFIVKQNIHIINKILLNFLCEQNYENETARRPSQKVRLSVFYKLPSPL